MESNLESIWSQSAPQIKLREVNTTPLPPSSAVENVENLPKPCPDCGCEPLIDVAFKRVSCPYCGARTPWCDSLEEAIRRWNMRVEEPGETFYREQQELAWEQMRREMDE